MRRTYSFWERVARQGEGGGSAPDVQTPTPDPATPEPPAEPPAPADSTPEPAAEGGKKPWYERRIDELTRDKHEALRKASAADQALAEKQLEIENLRKGLPPGAASEGDIQKRAEALAAQRVAEQEFTQRCNAVYDTGLKEYKDFNTQLGNFSKLGGMNPTFLNAVLETDEPHKVIYALAQDLDEASRIFALPPLKQAVVLSKLSAKLAKAPEPVSQVPAPPKPIGGGAGAQVEKDPDKMTTAEWMEWRKRTTKLKR